ncbi:methyltransferase family protein [Arthrobacter sp. AG258]|uniref:class I SAM-dependent methyltransferase n=1 Tax=Arthrobacter sp. AG258 TaxID=2183899 RepID=UPI0010611411|nr:class I SAM-dependent methyltransferase [Arthrobacter sp. AG258]TDT81858.1 methyltransferase family protein [Arthrobacter sp. AG258]
MELKYKNVASVYDLVYESRIEDVEFYLQEALRAQPKRVVELGCGTGRVTLPLAKLLPNSQVFGIDMDADEIAVLAGSIQNQGLANVDVKCENITSFAEKDIDLVIAPFRVFQHVLNLEEFRACLRTVASCLKPGASFHFDLFNPSIPLLAKKGLVNSQVFEDSEGYKIERTVNVHDQDYFAQTQLIEEDYVITAPDGSTHDLHWHYRTRYYFLGEVVPIIEASGFRIDRVNSDFTGTAYGQGAYPGDLVFKVIREG